MTSRGFTLVELLVSLTVTLLIAGVLAATAPVARAAFDRVPVELDVQQRGRIAIDTLARALRAATRVAVAVPADEGRYRELTTVTPVESAAQGVLAIDQASPAAPLILAAWRCPGLNNVCGFTSGAAVMIGDGHGAVDVFTVGSTNAILRSLTPAHALSRAYPAASIVLEVEQNTFGLDQQDDGTYSLSRVTAAGAVQPIVDGIRALAFRLEDQRVDVEVIVHPPAGAVPGVIADRVFTTSITVRNTSW